MRDRYCSLPVMEDDVYNCFSSNVFSSHPFVVSVRFVFSLLIATFSVFLFFSASFQMPSTPYISSVYPTKRSHWNLMSSHTFSACTIQTKSTSATFEGMYQNSKQVGTNCFLQTRKGDVHFLDMSCDSNVNRP